MQRGWRLRARKRGENVVKRKPGPKPATITELRMQVRDLSARVRELEQKRQTLTHQLSRQPGMLSIAQLTRELLGVMRRVPPEYDSAEDRD
jgi:hypothetical protein